MRFVALLTLLVATLAPAGCRAPVAATGPDSDRLAEDEARWRAAGVSAYEMTYRVICFCTPETAGPWTVRVEGGRVTRVVGPTAGAQPPGGAQTVASLFDQIREARRANADSIAVTYDPQDGHPVTLRIDRSFQTADEEIAYEVTGFTRLR